MSLNLNRLNDPQRRAVLHTTGPLLVLAGAGSGKTSTMAYRIAYLLAERHVPPYSIVGLSFTNKAALELKERVSRLTRDLAPKAGSRRLTRGLTVTTFHSLCARILRQHAELLGFQKQFTILDQNDQVDVLRQVLRNIQIDDRRFDPQVLLFEMSQAKNRFLTPAETETFFLESGRLSGDYAIAAASSVSRYQDQLRILNAMDFDDLIFYTVQLFTQHPEVLANYQAQWRYLLVDEYQDTNPAQFQILKFLTQTQDNICVVGDDDQSIYAWRGADPSHILEFTQQYPHATTIVLEQNYRSTSRILDAAHQVIDKNSKRHPKKLWSDRGIGEPIQYLILEEDRAEADFVGEEILRRTSEHDRSWDDFAILYRSHSQSRVFEEALRRRGIPYRILGGLSFLERKEVKNTLAYWRLITNPKDDSALRRVLNWPARGIGKTSMEVLSATAFQKNLSLFASSVSCSDLPIRAQTAMAAFREKILKLHHQLISCAADATSISIWAKQSLEQLQVKAAIEADSDDPVQAAKKWENIEELLHSIGQFQISESEEPPQAPSGLGSLLEFVPESDCVDQSPGDDSELDLQQTGSGLVWMQEFLNRMSLEAQDQEKKEEDTERKNQVTLLTLHGAKGLEFRCVFLVGMEEGFLPHQRTLDEKADLSEERRLCYVGMTRAKDLLFLTRVRNRIRYGKAVPRIPSRFLGDVSEELCVQVNASSSPDLSSKTAQQEHETRVKNYLADIRSQLLKPKSRVF